MNGQQDDGKREGIPFPWGKKEATLVSLEQKRVKPRTYAMKGGSEKGKKGRKKTMAKNNGRDGGR